MPQVAQTSFDRPSQALPAFDLSGRIALVTGASSGLGRHFAGVLSAAGASVVLAARRTDALHSLAEQLGGQGRAALAVTMDVTSGESVAAAMSTIQEHMGIPDIVINNAGISGEGFLLRLSEADWDAVIDTNLKGAFLVSQLAAQAMSKTGKGGSIINIASILGLRVAGALGAYCASKAALLHFTKASALELARYRIRVNAIAPGYVETDINRDFFHSEPGQKMIERIPMRRLGQMHELDGPLLLLASEAGAYMTGAVLEVDGGHLCSSL